MTISRASLVPLTTGPPANAVSPADSALVVTLAPLFLTTVSLTIFQVQVVPSGDLITTSLPFTDWMVPRSNESVWNPFLLWNVTVPSTPPRRRIRPSAHRTRAAGTEETPAASVSTVFSWAAPALADAPETVLEAGLAAAVVPPPDTAARAMPPPARKPARVMPAPHRNHFLRGRPPDRAGTGVVASAGYPPSASG